jgi:CubicO group peptidase (beta-lactamase class C family)
VYAYRVLVWQGSDYDDFTRFKTKTIKKGMENFQYTDGNQVQKNLFKQHWESANSITDIDSFLEANNTYSFIVIRNDTLLYEQYFNGSEKNSVQTSFSTAKSILSLLVGVAIKEGKIDRLKDPITKYLPELTERDDRFGNITINDLLHMRSGIQFRKGIRFPILTCDEPLTYSHPDLRYVALQKTKIEREPDTRFLYNDYNALLLGLILERATGAPVNEYLESKIWQKIGMEYDGSWNADNNGFEQMQSGLNARSIDFAKIGRLVLHDGYWNDQSVVDSNWVMTSTTVSKDTLQFNSGQQWSYSKLWWNAVNKDRPDDVFACGHMGQFIFISPSSNTIIVRNGLQSDNLDDDDWIDLFTNFCSPQFPRID